MTRKSPTSADCLVVLKVEPLPPIECVQRVINSGCSNSNSNSNSSGSVTSLTQQAEHERCNLVRVDSSGCSRGGGWSVVIAGDGCKRSPNGRKLLIELGPGDTAKLLGLMAVAGAECLYKLGATVATLQVNGDFTSNGITTAAFCERRTHRRCAWVPLTSAFV